jgi:putative glutamine amidotransferase
MSAGDHGVRGARGAPGAPVVGLTPSLDAAVHLTRPGVFLYRNYVDLVVDAGMIPFVVPVVRSTPAEPIIGEWLGRLDGVLLTGGDDIDPDMYGAAPHPLGDVGERERAVMEMALVRHAIARRIPVLGICLGVQTINVALGGTLYQHVPEDFPASDVVHGDGGENTVHPVRIQPGSVLARVLDCEEALVNSFHHQAVKRPGEGLAITAWASDGVPEAVEWAEPREPFLLGVQWHPERSPLDPLSQRLLAAFRAECLRAGAVRRAATARA